MTPRARTTIVLEIVAGLHVCALFMMKPYGWNAIL